MEEYENTMGALLHDLRMARSRHHEPGSVEQQREDLNCEEIEKNISATRKEYMASKLRNPNKICKMDELAGSSENTLEAKLALNDSIVKVSSSLATQPTIQLLPECWKMVLENLDDPESMEACYNTCSGWRNDLAVKRTYFLFHKVIPFLGHHLDNKSIVTCRLVSPMWKEAVDGYRDDIMSRRGQGGGLGTGWVMMSAFCFCYDYWFHSLTKVDNFVALATRNSGSRVPAYFPKQVRFSDVVINNDLDCVRFWLSIVTKLLPMYGNQVTTCSFVISKNLGKRLIHIINIAILSQLHNLSDLTIDNWLVEDVNDFDDHIAQFGVSDDFMPSLKNLKHALIHNKVPAKTLEALLNSPSRDTSLNYYNDYDNVIINKSGMETLTIASQVGIIKDLSGWHICGLKKLIIKGGNFGENITSANLFKGTLEKLVIYFNIEEVTNLMEYRLELPHLHILIVEMPQKWLHYDFLLPLKKLKILTINGPNETARLNVMDVSGTLQIVGFEDHFYDSNTWKLLPELRIVKFKLGNNCFFYERDELLVNA